jgi:phosphomannomutase/phosphoglucomutase
MTKIAERARFNMIPLFLEADGNFPNHHPNPMLRENREHAKNAILESNADLGLLFDGDADRVVILDSR